MVTSKTFPKEHRLKSRDAIQQLFKAGTVIKDFPLKLIYTTNTGYVGQIKIGISVPKKNIKLAVTRNLIKRRIKEAYRLNSHEMQQKAIQLKLGVNCMIIYQNKKVEEYALIEAKIKVILNRLTLKLEQNIQ